ncbi:response regulator [Pseudomonas fluorescens]|uniref:Response regulator n=1 Tax=Pseudomonas fluorescens TaxID=294 RepID=A0A423MS94_PSEFL|nr:response regulator [Pseudomonas fluorescens]RON88158.1 response regulator [Pseudomonas fluorescens]
MKILIVEDDENKRVQLSDYLKLIIPDEVVLLERSLQSGVRRIKNELFDLVILDMTLPMYDVSPDEPSDDTHIFGGREFLSQMDRFDINIPVVVFTQFEVFGKPPNEMRLEDLDRELSEEYSNYQGAVYYHASLNSWKDELRGKLVFNGFVCIE